MAKNTHIDDYLRYYLSLKHPPGFAVLIHGDWGSGKTWFIKTFTESYTETMQLQKPGFTNPFLFVSLYGIRDYSAIDDQLFQQLHPILSSKPVALLGRIAKSALRTTLKFEIDSDKRDQISIAAQPLEVNAKSFLMNTDNRVLVFDDLERISMPLKDVLGYINTFIEHQNLKVIILANEDEILRLEPKHDDAIPSHSSKRYLFQDYSTTKEKIIGKSFKIAPDAVQAFESFILEMDNLPVSNFLKSRSQNILDIFECAGYNNLRHMKQAFLEFELLFLNIDRNFWNNSELMDELLRIYLAFCFEIRKGYITPHDIPAIKQADIERMVSAAKKKDFDPPPIYKVKDKYGLQTDFLLTPEVWVEFFVKGHLSSERVNESLKNSRYCQDENTESWIKLWHFRDLEDDEFNRLLDDVIQQMHAGIFEHPGQILHICGLLLSFSRRGFIDKNTNEIADECNKYISDLSVPDSWKDIDLDTFRRRDGLDRDGWGGLGFAGTDIPEFDDLREHLIMKLQDFKDASLPSAGSTLLKTLSSDPKEFYKALVWTDSGPSTYDNVPVLAQINVNDFLNHLLALRGYDTRFVSYTFGNRYKYPEVARNLVSELTFLKELDSLLEIEIENMRKTIRGFNLNELRESGLKRGIAYLERIPNHQKDEDR